MSLKYKKNIILSFLVILAALIFAIYYVSNIFITKNKEDIQNTENENMSTYSEVVKPSIILPTKGNDMVVPTTTSSTIRVINEFDKSMFEGKKNILFMWGTWCTHCLSEMKELKNILDCYKDSDINIVFISHDFDIETLIAYIDKKNMDLDTEILLDLGRVIRTSIDPDASTVPITYFLNEMTEVKYTYNRAITFDEVQQILKDLKWI